MAVLVSGLVSLQKCLDMFYCSVEQASAARKCIFLTKFKVSRSNVSLVADNNSELVSRISVVNRLGYIGELQLKRIVFRRFCCLGRH